MWYYILICAMLCICFSSKQKATNVFPKHISKSDACHQSIKAGKILFCCMIVKNYLCHALLQFLINIKSMWWCFEQTSELSLLYCGRTVRSSHQRCFIKELFFKISQYSQESTSVGLAFWKRDTNICNFLKKRHQHSCFLWILQIF